MRKSKCFWAVLACILLTINALGQSNSFKLGQWLEIEASILKELNKSYVDTLPLDRIMREGIDKMLENLDPYTIYVPEEENDDFEMLYKKSYGGIGAVIHKTIGEYVSINEPYIGTPAVRAGLQCGDQIMEIDGESTLPLTSSESSDKMKGKPGTTVIFKVKKVRSGEIVEIPVVRERIHLPDLEYVGMLNDSTGYIVQSGFTMGVASDIKAAYYKLKKQGMKHLILDLRGNGGGLLDEAVQIVSLFVPTGSLVVTAKGNDPSADREYRTTSAPIDTEIPLTILVDSGSASASEIVAGAIQDFDRGTIMGHRTFGKGLVQSIRPLAYNGQLKITTAKYYTPSGRCVQAIDYSRRNEDGSVGAIPDSLTHEFTTAHGRIVRDGGGITPDIALGDVSYSRLVYAMVLGGVINSYCLHFAQLHEQVDEDYYMSDEDFEDFVAYALTQEFDYRSSAQSQFDAMKKELEKDGLYEALKAQVDALEEGIKMEKEAFIRLKKEELRPFIEEEIAVRYHFQEAGVKVRIRYDEQLKEALEKTIW